MWETRCKPDLSGLSVGHTSSGAEAVARWAKGARVVKALGFDVVDARPLAQARTLEPLAML